MAKFRGSKNAFGAPGSEAYGSHSDKEGVGTAYSPGSRVWFTIWNGILTEVYYPTIDRPQLRDLYFIIGDGEKILVDERSGVPHKTERILPSQGYRITVNEPKGRFSYTKEIIADVHNSAVLICTRFQGEPDVLKKLKVYVLCAPHLESKGEKNNAYIVEVSGQEFLAAERKNRWLVVGASAPFSRLSCGYAGASDGCTDIQKHHKMTFEFHQAEQGNVVLTAELPLPKDHAFTVGLAFSERLTVAASRLLQSLAVPFPEQRNAFVSEWQTISHHGKRLEAASFDGGKLFRSSYNVLLTHQDKFMQGAFIASLTTPWGEVRNDRDGEGGYHLVWTRDMVETALGLLAADNREAPLSALIYLAAHQEQDGSFPQNFWVDGEAFRSKTQLDEVAFPVLLAWRLFQDDLLKNFDARPLVQSAVRYLLHSGPVTEEERWEEASGYSPSTLAAIISASICGAEFAKEAEQTETAHFLEDYADFLYAHLKEWTVTKQGSLIPNPRYFIRLNPVKVGQVAAPNSVDNAEIELPSQPPGSNHCFPARNIVDAGFLQLVRYGILKPDDPVVVNSLQAVDATLKHEMPCGTGWRRYNHDGYGQGPHGEPFQQWGTGRCWPLLTGERAHYELAAGSDYEHLVQSMEKFGGSTELLPEQVWDEPDLPEKGLYCGGPTGSAVPLVWAHSEYMRLLRSCLDQQLFDLIPPVAARYANGNPQSKVEFWLPNHPIEQIRRNCILRICAEEPFRLRWSTNQWVTYQEVESASIPLKASFVDLAAADIQNSVEFTLFWIDRDTWEGQNYSVRVTFGPS